MSCRTAPKSREDVEALLALDLALERADRGWPNTSSSGWMTGGTAQRMAADQAQTDVVAALTAICIDQSKRDPQLAERIALLKAASSWERGDLVVKHGWATMPGTTEGNRLVARACAEKVGI